MIAAMLNRLLAVLGILAVALVLAWWLARPAEPDHFYDAPAQAPARPGVLLKREAFGRGLPAGAQGWRILYTTSRLDGTPGVASALVVVPRAPAATRRPVIAWAHGTTGVEKGCAPSMTGKPFDLMPAFAQAIDNGWAVVAPDYVGLGTSGPHPYLVGEGEARSVLDAVRAARQMQEGMIGDRTVVWGHSQGGHAALWAALLAPAYAPDAGIAGVAAAAPATDLPALIDRIQHSPVGAILSSYTLRAYAEAYADVELDDYVRGGTGRFMARDMAGRCMAGLPAILSAVQALSLGGTIFDVPPTGGAFGRRLADNVPARPIAAPVLIAQGLADEVVAPDLQGRFVQSRCAAGQPIRYLRYEGRDHLSLVAADSPLTDDLVRWTRQRFEGVPAEAGCSEATR